MSVFVFDRREFMRLALVNAARPDVEAVVDPMRGIRIEAKGPARSELAITRAS